MTQPSMVREAGGLNPGGKSHKRLAGRSWEWRDKTLRESRNLIVTEKEESPLTRLQPQAAGDLRVRLLGSWAVKGPVYSECSEGVQPQKVRWSLTLAVARLSWRSSHSLLKLPSGCNGALPGSWKREKRDRLATATGAHSPFVRPDRQTPDMEHTCSAVRDLSAPPGSSGWHMLASSEPYVSLGVFFVLFCLFF